jgi:hypothetical protein
VRNGKDEMGVNVLELTELFNLSWFRIPGRPEGSFVSVSRSLSKPFDTSLLKRAGWSCLRLCH